MKESITEFYVNLNSGIFSTIGFYPKYQQIYPKL